MQQFYNAAQNKRGYIWQMAEIACCRIHTARGVILAAVRFEAKTTLEISASRLARVFCCAQHDNHKQSHIG